MAIEKGDHLELADASARSMKRLQSELPLSRSQFYNFNLQHLSDWANHVKYYNGKDIWSKWKFEAQRIFRDRLINEDDRAIFDNIFNDKYRANDIYFPDASGQMNRIDFESLQSILTNIGAGYGRDIGRVGTNFWLKIGGTEEIFSGELISNFKKAI